MKTRDIAKAFRMREEARKNMSARAEREERLAAKLRENLRRRKAQARAVSDSGATETLPNSPREG